MFTRYRETSGNLSEDEVEEELNQFKANDSMNSTRISNSNLPDEWNDDVRMNVLFSEFRERDLNPAAYDGKMKFWVALLEKNIVEDGVTTFSISQLRDKFQRKGKKPQCLETVIAEMQRRKIISKANDFLSASQESWLAWGVDNFVKKPLWWSAKYALGLSFGQNPDEETYISVDLIKRKASAVLEKAHSGILSSSVIDVATFKELFGNTVDETALPFVLKHLQRNNEVAVTDLEDPDHATIKFLRLAPSKTSTMKSPQKISEADKVIVKLRKSLQQMEKEVATMQAKIEEADGEVRALVRTGKKPAAIRILKKKKLLEKSLAQKDIVLTNMENMLFRLENTESDEKVLEAYKAGVSALKKVNEETSVEKIDTIVDDMQEALDIQQELSDALSSPTKTTEVIDEDELEKELNDLLADHVTDDLLEDLAKLKIPGESPGKELSATKSEPSSNKSNSSTRIAQAQAFD